MSHNHSAPKLLIYLFAVPIVALVYVATFANRLWAALRPTVAALLGYSVIGSTYAGEAIRRAPAKPIRAAAALGLAVVLIAPAAPAPAMAASDPAQAVVDAALGYVGYDYKFGAEGPDKFDCSGLIYAVFKDVGELPRIGGSRMGATAYMRWFVARGRFSHDVADARPGDLVVWKNGHHIGIYIGNNRVVSALNENLGVRVTDLTIPWYPTQFLLVNWGRNDGGGGDNPPPGGGDNGNNPPPDATPTPDPGSGDGGNGASDGSTDFVPPDNGTDNPPATPAPETPKPTAPPPPTVTGDGTGLARTDSVVGTLPTTRRPANKPAGFNGLAIATVNLRESPDATSRILGWVGSGGYVAIVDQAYSPQGNLYYKVQTASGSSGWVYARWVLNTP